MGLANYNL